MLAIIIPYYKLTYFEATLQSLAAQTDSRFTVYIGDDNSPEDPTLLLAKYQGAFPFNYFKFDSNLGGQSLTKQWERCIALSNKEEWLMILGDDDYLETNVVASFYAHYDTFYGRSELVRFASKIIYESRQTVSDIFYHPEWESASESFYRKFLKVSRSSLSEHVFSRKVYQKYGFTAYPLAWNSDDRAWLDFSDNKPLYTINESTICIRVSDLNISGKRDNLILKNKSEISFYRHLISKWLGVYSTNQRLELLKKYGKEIRRNRNLKFSEWLFILYYCVRFMDVGMIRKAMTMLRTKLKM